MTEHDIRTAFGEAPASFCDQIDRTLMQLEDEPMKKRYKFTTVFALAALITVLLAGAAVAATQLKLTDYLRFSLPEAAETIHTEAIVLEDENIRCEIEEIMYDGYGLAAQMKIINLKPDQHSLVIRGDTKVGMPNPDLIPIQCDIVGFINDVENKNRESFLTERMIEHGEDGTIRVYASDFSHFCRGLWQTDGFREKVLIEFELRYSQPDAEDTTLTASLELNGNTETRKYYLTKQNSGEFFEVDTFELVCTESMMHCNAYIYVPGSYANMDTDDISAKFSLITPDGAEYPFTVFRLGIHHAGISGWRGLNLSGVLPAITNMPDTVFIAMRDAETGELIEQTECAVTATDQLAPLPTF